MIGGLINCFSLPNVTSIFLLSMLSLAQFSLVHGEKGSILETVADSKGESKSIQRKLKTGENDPSFTPVQCLGSIESGMECYPVELASGKFLLVDCFGHDGVGQSCRLLRFNSNGSQDKSFNIPFSSSLKELMGNAENEIKSIHEVKVGDKNETCVLGSFISPLINWTQQDAYEQLVKNDVPGDVLGKSGNLCFEENGTFKSFSPVYLRPK